VPVAVDNHIAGLIYCKIGFFINGPIVIARLIDDFDRFSWGRRRSRRFFSPEVKVFQYLFYYKIFGDEGDYFHLTTAFGA